ncbi:MAG TPA: hypothetical protein VN622_18465, partial [Clostridia bacterium]|nr:hypothetical protein [Clostridia bacterium]
YSPTYWFRVMRAQQLLQIWRDDPAGFRALAEEYRGQFGNALRAPHRLSVWLKGGAVVHHTVQDGDVGDRLVIAPDNPEYLGYTLRVESPAAAVHTEAYLRASPAALGALAYIAFETRRMLQCLDPGGKFRPLEVVSLVKPIEEHDRLGGAKDPEFLAHATGEVFDIDASPLSSTEREALDFVLDDLGWNGYLGFVREAPGSNRIHIGPSPASREFFTRVFEEASGGSQPPLSATAPGSLSPASTSQRD